MSVKEGIVAADSEQWDLVIGGEKSIGNSTIKDLWRYRDLLMLFVKKDIITVYKQTLLGPIWFVVQPLLTTLTFVLVFGRLAKIGTDGIPQPVFYMGSVTLWNYFAENLNITSRTFTDNATIFGKVYFPRIILPLSKIISGIVKFLIQFGLFIIFWLYYLVIAKTIHPNIYILLFPFLLVLMGVLSLGLGIIITSMTTKYRDLSFLVAFGVQLFMYVTPVIFPASKFQSHQVLLFLNPMTSIFETFKFGFLGHGTFSWLWLGYTTLFSLIVLVSGLYVFNKVEKRFIDTV